MNEKSHAILMKTGVLTKSDYVTINMKYCFTKILINKNKNNLDKSIIYHWIGCHLIKYRSFKTHRFE